MRFDVLPNGNIVIPFYNVNKVIEYDSEGKSVWEVAVTQPTSVQRLPNGRTFIGSRYQRLRHGSGSRRQGSVAARRGRQFATDSDAPAVI